MTWRYSPAGSPSGIVRLQPGKDCDPSGFYHLRPIQPITACKVQEPAASTFPPLVYQKIMGINVCFFPQCPKITEKSWDLTGFSYGSGIYLFFLCVCPKSTGILGISEKNSLLCPGSENKGLKQGIGPRQRRTCQNRVGGGD